jgi:glycerophosphoryl diester phosphodiesterase
MTLLSLDRVMAIAHRGGSALRPENTLVAFDHAVSLGVDGLEFDARCSRDGEVVVIHDPTLQRTTNGVGAVKDFTADELARLDAGAQFGKDRGYPYRGQEIRIPTLRSVLSRYSQIPAIVEIKGNDPVVADRTLEIIRALRADDRVILAGFSHAVISHVRRVAPHIPTSGSRREVKSGRLRSMCRIKLRLTGYQMLGVPFRFGGRQILTRAYAQAALRAGIPVYSWVVDRREDLATIIDWGVTGLISDRPDLAVEAARAPTTASRSLP